LSRTFHKAGRLQTLETGACAGDKRVVVHDKGAELKHYNEKHKIKEPLPKGAVTRIEIVMQPSLTFAALANMPNPFGSLDICAVPAISSAKTLEFELFVKLAQLGGLQRALLGLPEAKQKQFKASFARGSRRP